MLNLSPTAVAAIDEGRLAIRTFLSFFPDEGPIHLWDDWEHVSIGGIVYEPVGDLVSISGSKSGSEFVAEGFQIYFNASGLDNQDHVVTGLEQGSWHQRPVTVHYKLFDMEDNSLMDEIPVFDGDMDKMDRNEDIANDIILTIECESIMRRLERRTLHTRTSVSQNLFYPDDRGFDYVETVGASQIGWGKKQTALTPGGSAATVPAFSPQDAVQRFLR